jgi:hypothetical protein
MRIAKLFGVVLVFAAGALLGSSRGFGGAAVTAQESQVSMLHLGDKVQLRYEADVVQPCHVDEIRGHFVRCTRDKGEEWHNVDRVQWVARLSPWSR